MDEIKLIVFDLWKTLAYKKNNKNHKGLKKMLKTVDSKISVEDFVIVFENSIQRKKWKTREAAYGNLCKNMKVEETKENINALMKIRGDLEKTTKLYSHTLKMIKRLKAMGYKIGIISNSSVFAIEEINKKTKLIDLIDYPIFSFNVGVVKPHPKIYKVTLKRAGAKPCETIMIGDKLKDDVLPCQKLGMNAIHYKNYKQLKKDFREFGINL